MNTAMILIGSVAVIGVIVVLLRRGLIGGKVAEKTQLDSAKQ